MAYQPNNWSPLDIITSEKLNDLEKGLLKASEDNVFGHGGANQPSDGIHSFIVINKGDPMPSNPQPGDTVFIKDGDDYTMVEWNGEEWALRLDPKLSERIDKVLDDAKTQSEQLITDNNVEINKTIDTVAQEKIDLAIKDADFNENAQAMADKALSDAKANTTIVAQETLNSANQNIADAKKSLSDSINKEVTDRANVVTALDTKAKGYADTAKADAISASTTALNTAKTDLTTSITKEVTDRTKAVSDLDTKAQGYATQAKTDAIATANGAVAKEVTDRQKAITDLDAKSTGAINQAKTDAQSALDALQVGGRNLVLNSSGLNGSSTLRPALKGATTGSNVTLSYQADGIMITNGATNKTTEWYYQIASSWTPFSNTPLVAGNTYTFSADVMGTVPQAVLRWGFNGGTGGGEYSRNFNINNTSWTRVSITTTPSPSNTGMYWRIQGGINNQYASGWTGGETLKFRSVKIEIGNKATDYTQAPEDIVLDYTTKDNVISQSLTQYQATNDGKVTKAQTDATTALGLVATKVSQTDYDTKTGDLSSKYTQVKQTVDSQATDIVDIKKTASSQASKINSISSDVDGTKQSISDIETTQDSQSDKINQITTDVNGTKQSITDIQTENGKQDARMGTIETSVSGVKSDFSSYKTTNDGVVKTAQTTAQTAVDGLKNKVSQTDYNTKTGQLQTDLTSTTQTANKATTDIASIKQKDSDQDSRMTRIESDASGVKTTVSDLQTAQGKQSGDISTLQQRADGFDATVTKVNNLSVGGRNYVQNSSGLNGSAIIRPTLIGASSGANATVTYPGDGILMTNGATNTSVEWYYQVANAWANFSDTPLTPGKQITFSADVMGTVPQAVLRYGFNGGSGGTQSFKSFDINNTSWTRVSITVTSTSTNTGFFFRIQGGINNQCTTGWSGGETLKFRYVKIEDGNTPTAWSPAPEDLSGATAKAQLTADNASLDLSKYQTDADGRITKAQSDITQTAKDVTTKVSQTDYNAKTGDLTTKVNTAQSTADSANSTIRAYKTSNDGRVATAESKITQNTKDITTKVSQTVYDAKTNQLQTDLNTTTTTANKATTDIVSINQKDSSQDARMTTIENDANGTKTTVSNLQTDLGKANGSISTLKQRADGFDATVTKVNNLAVGGRNLLIGTNSNDKSTLNAGNGQYTTKYVPFDGGYKYQFTYTTASTNWSVYQFSGWVKEKYEPDTDYVLSFMANFSVPIKPSVLFANGASNNNFVQQKTTPTVPSGSDQRVVIQLHTNATIPIASDQLLYIGNFQSGGAGTFTIWDLKIEKGNLASSYTPAPEDIESALAQVKVTADGVSSIVTDPTKGLSVRVQTAEGTLNTVKSTADGAMSKASQTANDITKEISDRKTGDNNTLQSSKDFTQSSITSYDRGIQSQFTQTASGILAQVESTNMVVNSEFDPLNGTWYAINGTALGTAVSVTQSTMFIDWPVVDGSRLMNYAASTFYSTLPVHASAGKPFSASLVAGRPQSLATSTALDFRIGFWDSNKKIISQISAGNIIDGTAAKSIDKYKIENKIAPANTAYVSIIIAHSSATSTDVIGRPMLNNGTTVSPYASTYGTTNSSTILSLFKDNYSFGINSDGTLVSGLAGNQQSVTLKGNAITLDGKVNVTSEFYALGGNFKNLNAANLVGTNASFFQANFRNAYGSQLNITGSGMVVYYSDRITSFDGDGLKFKQIVNYTDGTSGLETIGAIITGYSGTVNIMMMGLYDQTYKSVGSPSGEIWGGDMIGWSRASNHTGDFDNIFTWSNGTAASNFGTSFGFNFYDRINFNQNEIVSGGNFNFLMSSTKFGSGYFGGKSVPSISATWLGNTGGGIAFGNDNVIIYAPGKTKIIL